MELHLHEKLVLIFNGTQQDVLLTFAMNKAWRSREMLYLFAAAVALIFKKEIRILCMNPCTAKSSRYLKISAFFLAMIIMVYSFITSAAPY